jgi:uncharacterized membrane protein YraQ (UPF0718 family)
MMFEAPNLKPPSKFDKLMEKYALPILIVAIGSILSAVLLGKILIVDFNWLMLALGFVLAFIVGYYVRYSIRTKKDFEKYIVSLKDEHDKQIAAMRQEVKASKDEYWKLVQDNTQIAEEWRENFRQSYQKDKELSAREQKERLEEVEKQFSAHLENVNTGLSTWIKNNNSLFGDWTQGHANAHREEQKLYKHQLKALEERLTDKQISVSDN